MKVLIIRFSSFGDILQSLPVISALKEHEEAASIDYLTKSPFTPLLKNHPSLHTVLTLSGNGGITDLWRTSRALHKNQYTHVYDAHNNLRSHILCLFLRLFNFFNGPHYSFIRRPKNRWKRFLFFKWRRPVFEMPFRGATSYLEPLKEWSVNIADAHEKNLYLPESPLPPITNLPLSFIAIAPSAAWPNKRWPPEHWRSLIASLPEHTFVILGGPEDIFCKDIAKDFPNAINLAGQLSLIESCLITNKASLVISNDTGLLHAADQLNRKTIALIGPTAFGYPMNTSSHVLETSLYCKPCSKDGRTPCVNSVYQKCMVDITPERVKEEILKMEPLSP